MTDQNDLVTQVRTDLMRNVTHYADVAAQHGAGTLHGERAIVNTAGASALLAAAYGHTLAALIGQMAKSGRAWTAEEAAGFVGELLANGDQADRNADIRT